MPGVLAASPGRLDAYLCHLQERHQGPRLVPHHQLWLRLVGAREAASRAAPRLTRRAGSVGVASSGADGSGTGVVMAGSVVGATLGADASGAGVVKAGFDLERRL
jgi:hypothetical protein